MTALSSSQVAVAAPPALIVDGVPLARRLAQVNRRARWRAFLFVSPLLLFLLVFFIAPIGEVLWLGVSDATISSELPLTTVELARWDGASPPSEAMFAALVQDLRAAKKRQSVGKIGAFVNFSWSGARSLFTSAARKADGMEAPFKAAMLAANGDWGDQRLWVILKSLSQPVTSLNYLNALDRTLDAQGSVAQVGEDTRIHIYIFFRTLWISLAVTLICLSLGFPVAYLLAGLPLRISNLLMICVLLPFWTALLVRITAWIAILQNDGVLLSTLVALGLVDSNNRPQLIYNATGTIVAMVHVLLPSMILPIYSVMKTIPPTLVRAARSLGATSFTAFHRVYLPQTLPGLAAGCLLVFILSVGYYITPALLGGQSGVLISNFIALNMEKTLNWGLAAALSGLLLVAILVLYWLFNRLVGINNLKLG